jgi:hypothetical protein
MDRGPHLRDIQGAMWIRPKHLPLARMPSMRPPPSAPAASKRRTPASPEPPLPEREEENDVEKNKRAGGFHESSYELRTGMDIFESEWPDDATIPGPLDDDH